ncbi:peptidylprolyl isomerase [Minwuia thermotolerans]|uniref:Parvulin-like PPIase n=1 Tax=Minwuia thermotolerans TaxID=2056226 RepID=A0A2M9G2R6_9PROT|nr:peptidylprolyl isomerase [Minwuia thermotolerans]PJK29984.1 peptidylprolyl isomerase [Minwuia thermotolerans]
MLKSRVLGAATALAIGLAAASAVAQQTQQAAPAMPAEENPVVARVGGQELRFDEVMALMQDLPQQYRQVPINVLYPMLVRRAVNNRLLLEAAKETDVAESEDLKAEVEAFRRSRILEYFLLDRIEAEIDEAALQARYEEYVKTADPEPAVHARHILLKTEDEARAVMKELEEGADFAELAMQKSTGPSGPQGGDLGFFQKGQMVPEFEAAAFAMEPGEVSESPVKTQFGWHVIKVEDRREHPTFEEKKEELRQEMSGEVIRDLIADLRDDAEIEEFQIDGSPLPPPGEAQGGQPQPAQEEPRAE